MQKCLRCRKLGSITFQEATILHRAEGKGSEGVLRIRDELPFLNVLPELLGMSQNDTALGRRC